ncbi:MAG: glycosyltransferase family 2 protein [Campylobacterales bacterium]|nr:glycosyltransferase family 2 protein [Campylobacterales bacterium]
MYKEKCISVVIPAYKVSKQVEDVVNTLPDFIDHIIVVDDQCPQHSSDLVKGIDKVTVVYHDVNQGVGGAMVSGYKKAVELNSDIVVKMDGDGQMDPRYIEPLIEPLVEKLADYSKGNRFNDFKALKRMPKVRLFGNSVLSFMVKVSSGYWNLMDPTNGFTAITSKAINRLNLDELAKRYFFETDMLINLNLENCVVKDVPIPAKYEDEESNLNIGNVIMTFPPKMLRGLAKRIFYKYYIYDFNMASIYLLLGLPLFVFGVIFGTYRWFVALVEHIENTTGTVMLAVLPIILGVQFLLQAVSIDIDSTPKRNA